MENRQRIITYKRIRIYRIQTECEPVIGSGDIEHIQRMRTCNIWDQDI